LGTGESEPIRAPGETLYWRGSGNAGPGNADDSGDSDEMDGMMTLLMMVITWAVVTDPRSMHGIPASPKKMKT